MFINKNQKFLSINTGDALRPFSAVLPALPLLARGAALSWMRCNGALKRPCGLRRCISATY